MIDPDHRRALKGYAHFKSGYIHVCASREEIRQQIGERQWKDGSLLSEEEWDFLLDCIKAEHAVHLETLRFVNLAY